MIHKVLTQPPIFLKIQYFNASFLRSPGQLVWPSVGMPPPVPPPAVAPRRGKVPRPGLPAPGAPGRGGDAVGVLLLEDGLLDPVLVGGDPGVDAGHVGPAAADAEGDDADLVPLVVLLADQGAAAVTLEREGTD